MTEKNLIRKATKDDIRQIVDIHLAALPDDLLPKLGKSYLQNTFYAQIIQSDLAFILVNVENDTVNAFCVFALNGGALSSLLTKNKKKLLIPLLRGVLKNVSLLPELAAHLKGFRTELTSAKQIDFESIPELYLIAAEPLSQGRGIGSDLIGEGLKILFRNQSACLVKTSSDKARKFYQKNGFELRGVEYRGKRTMYLLVIEAETLL